LENEREAEPQQDESSLRNPSGEKADESPKLHRVPLRIGLSSFIPRSRSKAVFALAMSCYCVTLSYFISTWARAAHVQSPPPAFYSGFSDPAGHVISLILVAPLIESLILVGVFELMRRARAPEVVQVITAALFVSEAHVWPWWPHAVIVLPSFCIQAASYLYWRRSSWKTAFWVLASIHALNNCIPAVSAIGRAIRHP
jgi:hypothetical protein